MCWFGSCCTEQCAPVNRRQVYLWLTIHIFPEWIHDAWWSICPISQLWTPLSNYYAALNPCEKGRSCRRVIRKGQSHPSTGFWSCWIKSSTLTLMVGLKSSANNNQCFSIQSNRILGQFCSSPITANLVCCDWLKIRTYPKIISATINSRRPNTCVR